MSNKQHEINRAFPVLEITRGYPFVPFEKKLTGKQKRRFRRDQKRKQK